MHREQRTIRRTSVGNADGVVQVFPVGLPFDLKSYARENFRVSVSLTYFDGIGRRTDSFCRGLLVELGNAYSWAPCDRVKDLEEYPPN